ncbi:hypothetical protein AVEN_272541-1 [Araneus ventricosus]|uniref:Uncharacterized protein n=1 Tax=Araneus ventricosus TaxID=182803 RepID=A0A4Y2E8Q1_ARAVE|nr:hypothetical protein AVEN_272541-1 [Araneus ventricosus]
MLTLEDTGLGCPIHWPARSRDPPALTSPARHMKAKMYETSDESVEDLIVRIYIAAGRSEVRQESSNGIPHNADVKHVRHFGSCNAIGSRIIFVNPTQQKSLPSFWENTELKKTIN